MMIQKTPNLTLALTLTLTEKIRRLSASAFIDLLCRCTKQTSSNATENDMSDTTENYLIWHNNKLSVP